MCIQDYIALVRLFGLVGVFRAASLKSGKGFQIIQR